MGIVPRLLMIVAACASCATVAAPARAGEEEVSFKSFDKFVLPMKIARPDGHKDADVKRVVILIHGSGPQNMDGDLTKASAGKKNLVYKDLSDALVGGGFTVIRYDKRAYVWNQVLTKDASKAKSKAFEKFQEAPLSSLVNDVKAIVKMAGKRFKKANVYLLGHSQGTYIAAHVANELPAVKGVGFIGTMLHSLDTYSFEQTVYRSLRQFEQIDKDRDGLLTPKELEKGGAQGLAILTAMLVLDKDGDKKLSVDEFKASACAQYLAFTAGRSMERYRLEEATYGRIDSVLYKATIPIAFFQGLWDNQTPAYNVMALEMIARQHWKKPESQMVFRYYPKLGHALDPRDDYYDVIYRPIDPKAKADVVKTLDGLFK